MTIFILLITLALLIVYDIFALLRWGEEKTISRVVLTLSKSYPIIPFGIGILCGHFFWSQHGA